MQEQIRLLRDLQELDQELSKVRRNRQLLEKEQEELGADCKRVQSMVDDLQGEIEALQALKGELNQGLLQEQGNIAKAEDRLPEIKTQKEYVAVLKEIDTAKKLNKDLQDQISAKESEIDSLNKDREEKVAELSELNETAQTRSSEIAVAIQEYDQVLEDRSSERSALLEKLPRSISKRYQMLFDRRGGVAVVEARNGNCLGCNMQLPPQLFNSLYMTPEILSCPHCNRLLFVLPQG